MQSFFAGPIFSKVTRDRSKWCNYAAQQCGLWRMLLYWFKRLYDEFDVGNTAPNILLEAKATRKGQGSILHTIANEIIFPFWMKLADLENTLSRHIAIGVHLDDMHLKTVRWLVFRAIFRLCAECCTVLENGTNYCPQSKLFCSQYLLNDLNHWIIEMTSRRSCLIVPSMIYRKSYYAPGLVVV
jgi:hypothetical protein